MSDASGAEMERAGADRWLSMERSGRRLTFVVDDTVGAATPDALRQRFPGAASIDVEDATLGEIFVALVRSERVSARRDAA